MKSIVEILTKHGVIFNNNGITDHFVTKVQLDKCFAEYALQSSQRAAGYWERRCVASERVIKSMECGTTTLTNKEAEREHETAYNEWIETTNENPKSEWSEKYSGQVAQPAPGKNKPFIAANVKDILMEWYPEGQDSVSFSRMVEMLNEVAEKYYQPAAGKVEDENVEDIAAKVYPIIPEDEFNHTLLKFCSTYIEYCHQKNCKRLDFIKGLTYRPTAGEVLSESEIEKLAQAYAEKESMQYAINHPFPTGYPQEAINRINNDTNKKVL